MLERGPETDANTGRTSGNSREGICSIFEYYMTGNAT